MGRRAALGATVLMIATILSTPSAATAATSVRHDYVDNALLLPPGSAEAAKYARNLDGEGGPDNALGKVIAALEAQNLDLTGMEMNAVTSGSLVVLGSLKTPSLVNTKQATWQVRYGTPTATPDFSGKGTFTVDPVAFRSARIPATIRDHHVRTSAAPIPLTLDLGAGPATFSTVGTRIFATCSKAACTNGRINGAIPEFSLNDTLIPGLVALFQPLVERDCPGPGVDSCVPQSAGQTIDQLFDLNRDLTITEQELRDSSLVHALLAPDVDMFNAEGKPGHDGVDDSLSFGIGFTAVRARLG